MFIVIVTDSFIYPPPQTS